MGGGGKGGREIKEPKKEKNKLQGKGCREQVHAG